MGAHADESYQGAAYVYERTGSTWSETQKLTASDGLAGDAFGIHTSLSGSYAVVGASEGTGSGSAYVFYRDPTLGWTQQTKLRPSDLGPSDHFGAPVQISGDYTIVGAHGQNSLRGAAYVYHRNGANWDEYKLPLPIDVVPGDRFGIGVSISGDYAVVGADKNNSAHGATYVYHRNESDWNVVAKLTASDGAADDAFGMRVGISGDYIIAGAAYNDVAGFGSGAAYLFKKPETGWGDMTETLKLTAPGEASDDIFGGGVSISGDYALIAACRDDNAKGVDAGSAFLYKISTSTLTSLTASDGVGGDLFGACVAISGNDAIVGADLKGNWTGAAYVFTVPEPSSFVLFSMAVVGFFGYAWRRQRQTA